VERNNMDMQEHTKHVLDTVSGITAFAAIMKFLPAVAALLSIVWYCIRIYEWVKSKIK
jgi:hypothetical protein